VRIALESRFKGGIVRHSDGRSARAHKSSGDREGRASGRCADETAGGRGRAVRISRWRSGTSALRRGEARAPVETMPRLRRARPYRARRISSRSRGETILALAVEGRGPRREEEASPSRKPDDLA
jgi:hypothetical protein